MRPIACESGQWCPPGYSAAPENRQMLCIRLAIRWGRKRIRLLIVLRFRA